MIGKGIKDMIWFIPLPNIPLPPFFACARSQTRGGGKRWFGPDASKLLQVVEYDHDYPSRPALVEGPSSKVIGRGMIGKGIKDMIWFITLPNIPLPLFFRS
jgi:hypothetical protein